MRATLKRFSVATLAAGVLAVSACGGDAAKNGSAESETSTRTLAALLADESNLSRVRATLTDVGLSEVFDGTAAYTILVPTDDAFAALGEAGEELREADQQAVMVAVMRDHILPGYFTPEDITNAIEAQGDGVTMATMGDGMVTFTMEGGTLTMRGADGSTAHISGPVLNAANGVAIPIDGVLKQLDSGA